MTRATITKLLTVVFVLLAAAGGSKLWLVVVILAFFAIIGMGAAFPQLRFYGPFTCRGKSWERCVALTFDDGPDDRSTPALLDLLRESGVPAAFFCVGQRVAARPELAERIVREGHLLENHSYTHSHFINFFTTARLRAELTRTQTAIHTATGATPQYYRPPMGLSNPRTFRAARSLGLKVIGWSVRGLDTRCADPEIIHRRIARRLAPGAIILLHDGNIPATRLLSTVKLLLATLHERGYKVVRLDQLLT
jgi:peptidoglycan/xylan/chitin deacetylase (PgdA/CDA1 family)